MAFPQVAATNSGNQATDSTSHTINLPSGIVAGNLLLAFLAFDGDPAIDAGLGWTQMAYSGSTSPAVRIYYKIATGSEGSTQNITLLAAEQSAHVTYRITGWHGTTPPEASTVATGTSTSPDPPLLDPSGWVAEDTLWLEVAAWDDGTTSHSSYSSGFSAGVTARANTSTGVGIAVGDRQINAVQLDPPVMALSTSEPWKAYTIAVRPAATGGGYSAQVLADSPVGYWRLGESSGTVANDETSNNLDGTYINTPTLGVTGAIAGNTAVKFVSASSEHLSIPDNNLFDVGDVFSLEFWVRIDVATIVGEIVLYDKGIGDPTIKVNNTGILRLEKAGTGTVISSTVSILDQNWHHVIVTKNGAAAAIYIDGVSRGGAVTNHTMVASTTTGILWAAFSPTITYDVSLDEIAIYPTALSQTRVQAHYNAATGGGSTPPTTPGTHTYDFEIRASGDDHTVWRDTNYPPTGVTNHGGTTDTTLDASRRLDGGTYFVSNGLLSWDTSGIPDNATISNASFRPHIINRSSNDGLSLTGEYFNWVSGSANNQSHIPATGAFPGVLINGLVMGDVADIPLSTPGSSISKTSSTKLRLHVNQRTGDAAPTAINRVDIASFDHATAPPPVLRVTYTVPSTGGTGNYPAVILGDSPRGYWRLDDVNNNFTALDSSNNGLHAAINNLPTVNVPGAFTGSTAFTFNGTNQYLAASDNALLDVGDVFSLECWMKSTSTADSLTLISKGVGFAYELGVHFGTNPGKQVHLQVAGATAMRSVPNAVTLNDGNWHHIVATKSGVTRKIYIDGVDRSDTAWTTNGTGSNNSTDLNIARRPEGTQYFPGSLDEVAVYGVALSASQVLAHYNAPSAPPTQPPPTETKMITFLGGVGI